MRTIWKYELRPRGSSIIGVDMPQGAEILHVAWQPVHNGDDPQVFFPTLWALVDTEREIGRYIFELVGTGHPMSTDPAEGTLTHVGSAVCGPFVWHVFQVAL